MGEARKALIAASLGWGLDSFDFYLYVYALPAIITTFGISNTQGGLLATYTLIASSIGGIMMGTLADRFGRTRMLMVSIASYSVFTFCSGLAQNYAQLAVFRGLEGLGFGGEWAVGSVLIAEWAARERRGRDLGLAQSAWAVGWFFANVAFQIVASLAPPQLSWRYLFFLGILPALAVLYVRRNVRDAPAFSARPNKRIALHELFRRDLLPVTLVATLLATGAQTGYYALFTWLPKYLHDARHLPAIGAGMLLYFVIVGAFAGYVSAGYVNDAIGRRYTFVLFATCSAIIAPMYLYVLNQNWQLYIAGPLLGYFASGIFSGFGAFLSELFPGRVRGSAQGLCYNAGRGIAGFGPALIGALSAHMPIGGAMTLVAISSYAVAAFAALALPETRGAELRA